MPFELPGVSFLGTPSMPMVTSLPSQEQLLSEAKQKVSGVAGKQPLPGVSTTNLGAVNVSADAASYLKVKLESEPSYGSIGDSVIFDYMPTLGEGRSANYNSFTPIQHPGEILKYEGSSARSWNLSAPIFSRTSDEAAANLKKIQLIRSWVMPFYGDGTANDPSTSQYLGAPPPILTLSAYGDLIIAPMKCVLESYNWDWFNNVDYINANANGAFGEEADIVPFPVSIVITLQLKETWSPAEYSAFSIAAYRAGDIQGAFSGAAGLSSSSQSNSTPAPSNPLAVDTSQISSVNVASVIGQPMIQAPSTGSITNLAQNIKPISFTGH